MHQTMAYLVKFLYMFLYLKTDVRVCGISGLWDNEIQVLAYSSAGNSLSHVGSDLKAWEIANH